MQGVNINNRTKCELLIPVGGARQLIAAVENGADAVYMGGLLFNARAKADNFDEDGMVDAIAFAHLRGVRVYVTMNTLISDEQLPRAVEYAKFFYENGVDAIIVQDLGFGNLLRKTLPNIELHLSTQGTVYSLKGVKMAERLGYSRVVTARELSLEEIKEITEGCKAEIEVFVHGALCFCYSGQCHLSRCFGGRSGNKGACAQPCRLPYTAEGVGKGYKAGEQGDYLLSPKDLNLVEHIDELVKAGVSSLKVEGRMKSPEYVATVTKIYRKYLDSATEDIPYSIEKSDKLKLSQAFNRGGFTEGYLYKNPEQGLMASKISKNQGVYLGKLVKGCKKGGVCQLKLASDEAFSTPMKGDVLEIENHKTAARHSFYVTLADCKGQSIFAIGDIKGPASEGDKVYRIISAALNKESRNTFEHLSLTDGKFLRRSLLDMRLKFEPVNSEEGKSILEGRLILEGKSETLGISATVESQSISHLGEITGSKVTKLKGNLGKLGGTPFELKSCTFEDGLPENIPLSLINQLRRQLVEALIEKQKSRSLPKIYGMENKGSRGDLGENTGSLQKAADDIAYKINEEIEDDEIKNSLENSRQVYFYTVKDLEGCERLPMNSTIGEQEKGSASSIQEEGTGPGSPENLDAVAMVPLADVLLNRMEWNSVADLARNRGFTAVIPYISHVSKGKEDAIIEENLHTALEIVNNTGIFLGNLEWIDYFVGEGVKVYGDFGLNIYNRETEKLFRAIGLEGWIYSSETFDDENGAYPLMISEHKIPAKSIVDRKNKRLQLVERPFSDQMIIKKHIELSREYMVKAMFKNNKNSKNLEVLNNKARRIFV